MNDVREQTLIGHIRCPLCLRDITTAMRLESNFVLSLRDDGEDLEGRLELRICEIEIVGGCEHAEMMRGKVDLTVMP